MNGNTLKCNPVGRCRDRAQPKRVSREIRDIHASALCEKYGNNIAEAKQNTAPCI